MRFWMVHQPISVRFRLTRLNLTEIGRRTIQKRILGKISNLSWAGGGEPTFFPAPRSLPSSWDRISRGFMEWTVHIIKHTTNPCKERLLPAQFRLFNKSYCHFPENGSRNLMKITRFFRPLFSFLRVSELNFCSGPKRFFQHIPMHAPWAINIIPRPSEIRSQLEFVASEVF